MKVFCMFRNDGAEYITNFAGVYKSADAAKTDTPKSIRWQGLRGFNPTWKTNAPEYYIECHEVQP
jgi:hypothetical protein